MRNKCKNLLTVVPVNTARECYDALIENTGNVEKAMLYLNDPKRMATRTSNQVESALRSNAIVEPQIKMDTMRLQKSFPGTSIQNCYLALRIAMGNVERAAKQLEQESTKPDGKQGSDTEMT